MSVWTVLDHLKGKIKQASVQKSCSQVIQNYSFISIDKLILGIYDVTYIEWSVQSWCVVPLTHSNPQQYLLYESFFWPKLMILWWLIFQLLIENKQNLYWAKNTRKCSSFKRQKAQRINMYLPTQSLENFNFLEKVNTLKCARIFRL
jgi:hypothetical protein